MVGTMRKLTTNLPGWSARHGEGCRRRDRRRTPGGVVAVNRRIPAMSSSPGSVRRRGCRGGLGEASGGGDLTKAACSSGNGAAKVEHGRGGVRVCSGERNRPREGERSEVARRGARGGPPYLRDGHGMDGTTRARGWRSTARSLQAPVKTTATIFQVTP